jgi:hypothetical protein
VRGLGPARSFTERGYRRRFLAGRRGGGSCRRCGDHSGDEGDRWHGGQQRLVHPARHSFRADSASFRSSLPWEVDGGAAPSPSPEQLVLGGPRREKATARRQQW